MVDVKVFTDQFGEVDKATEKRIKKLLRNAKTISQQQANILQSIIDDAQRELDKLKTVDEVTIFTRRNIFLTAAALDMLALYQNNNGKMFKYGTQFTNQKPSGTVRLLEESVKQSTSAFVTKMGDDIRTKASKIVSDGIGKRLSSNDISAQLKKELDITRARANTIARTEAMRAAHAGSYAQALREGKQFFIVDSRAEACIICKRQYLGKIFDITETRMMPPLHPNCACIPIYFDNTADAQRWADKIGFDIERQVAAIEKQGKTINKDGTGAEVIKIPADKRLKN